MSPLLFLALLRDLHPDLVHKCLNGSCFKLYLLLKEVFPQAVPYYDSDHVLTKIDGTFYDIRGRVLPSEHHRPMEDDSMVFNRAYLWGKEPAL